MIDSTLAGNQATAAGGGISSFGPLTVTGSTIVGNAVNGDVSSAGGGINSNGQLTVTNSTIVGNAVDGGVVVSGGGIMSTGPMTVTNATIYGNSASNGTITSVGGIQSQSQATLTNVIVAGNMAPMATDISAPQTTGSYNLIGIIEDEFNSTTGLIHGENGNQVGTSASPNDPLLLQLADNGGPTETMALDTGSPAIDAGNTADGATTDQRGTNRPQGAESDIGAFEVDSTPPVITPIVVDTLGDNGWYTSDVSVSWDVNDAPLSSSGCEPITINTDTAGQTLACEVTSTGGTHSESITIKRDATAPAIAFNGNLETYNIEDSILITCSASDDMSGIASSTCADIAGVGEDFGPGQHTFTATAVDNAGNTAIVTIDLVVGLTYSQLCEMTRELVRNAAVVRTACTTLSIAEGAERSGNTFIERVMLDSYRIHIRSAMSRRYVSRTDGQTLIEWSHAL